LTVQEEHWNIPITLKIHLFYLFAIKAAHWSVTISLKRHFFYLLAVQAALEHIDCNEKAVFLLLPLKCPIR